MVGEHCEELTICAAIHETYVFETTSAVHLSAYQLAVAAVECSRTLLVQSHIHAGYMAAVLVTGSFSQRGVSQTMHAGHVMCDGQRISEGHWRFSIACANYALI